MAGNKQIPRGYEKLFTGERGEDCNDTIRDIESLATEALAIWEGKEGVASTLVACQKALSVIQLLCEATRTDPVE